MQRSSAGFDGWIVAWADLDFGEHDDEDGLLVTFGGKGDGDGNHGHNGARNILYKFLIFYHLIQISDLLPSLYGSLTT